MTASAGAAQLTDADRPFELVEAADAVMRVNKSRRTASLA
jgi:hypothetical protein